MPAGMSEYLSLFLLRKVLNKALRPELSGLEVVAAARCGSSTMLESSLTERSRRMSEQL